MRILYGVVGEGMGHATRSRVVLEELVKEHEVQIVVSGRAQRLPRQALRGRAPHLGLHHPLRGERASGAWQTVLAEPAGRGQRLAAERPRVLRARRRLPPRGGDQRLRELQLPLRESAPDPGHHLDNMQVINRCRSRPSCSRGHEQDFQLIRSVVEGQAAPVPPLPRHRRSSTRRCARSGPRSSRPILRPEILAAKQRAGRAPAGLPDGDDQPALPEALKQTRRPVPRSTVCAAT